jgi:hypothetical protein
MLSKQLYEVVVLFEKLAIAELVKKFPAFKYL